MSRFFKKWGSQPDGEAAQNGFAAVHEPVSEHLNRQAGAHAPLYANESLAALPAARTLLPFDNAESDLQAWKRQDWKAKGWHSGGQTGNDDAFSEGTKEQLTTEIIQKFVEFQQEIHKNLKAKLRYAKLAIVAAGEHGEKAAAARLNKEFIDEQIEHCLGQIAKDHFIDRNSEILSILKAFRNGYDDGHLTSLRNTGLF